MIRCVQVVLPYATFGLIINEGRVVDAPPIARWAVGRAERDVADYYRCKGAAFRKVPGTPKGPPAEAGGP